MADGILAAIAASTRCPPPRAPLPEPIQRKPGSEALADLLRVLLKAKADQAGVAQRLVASSSELDQIASEDEPGSRPCAAGATSSSAATPCG